MSNILRQWELPSNEAGKLVGWGPSGKYMKNYSAVLSENNLVVNPIEARFGASGDGVTDDTAEVQAALDYLAAHGGGTLELTFPHLITSTLTYTSDSVVSVKGSNPYASKLIFSTTTDIPLLQFTFSLLGTSPAPAIERVGFFRTGSTAGGTALKIAYSDMTSGSYKGIEIIGCWFNRAGSGYWFNAIDLTRCTHATIERNFIVGQGGTASTKVGAGINLNTWCQGLTVHNNKVRGYLYGLLIDDLSVDVADDFQSEGYSIRGNTVSNCTNGLASLISSTEVSWLIQGNSFDCTSRGVVLDNLLRTQIIDNRFGWNGGHTDHADVMLRRTDGSAATSSTLQSIVANNRAFRKGDLELSVSGISRGATTTVTYTAPSKSRNITAISKANPCVVTYSGGDAFEDDDVVSLASIGGMTELNGYSGRIQNVNTTSNTFELAGLDSTGFTTYTSGGTATVSESGGTLANDDVLYIYGVGGTTELNRRAIKVASLNTGAGTFVAKDYETGADIVSTNYGAFTSGGTIKRYGRFFELKGGSGVDVVSNQTTFRSVGFHLWANAKDVTWANNRIIGKDGSSIIEGINSSSYQSTLSIFPMGGAEYLVRDGGAPGDGVKDDSPFLQSVLTAGKTVTLDPAKTYLLKTQLTWSTSHIGIEGNGALVYVDLASFTSTTKTNSYGTSGNVIKISGASYSSKARKAFVRNTRFAALNWIDSRTTIVISLTNTQDCDISGNEIYNFSRGMMMLVNDGYNDTFKNNTIRDCYQRAVSGTAQDHQCTGIAVDEGCAVGSFGVKIVNNTIRGLTASRTVIDSIGYQTDGINILGTTGASDKPSIGTLVDGNTIYNVAEGIDNFGTRTVINGNVLKRLFSCGLKLIHGARGCIVSSNIIEEVGYCGILLSGSSSATVDAVNNLIANNNIRYVNRAIDWYEYDETTAIYTTAGGQTWWKNVYNGGVGTTTAGIRCDYAAGGTNIDKAVMRGNIMDLGYTGSGSGANGADYGIFFESGTVTAFTLNEVDDNVITGFVTGKYRDDGNRLWIKPAKPHKMRQTATRTLANNTSAQNAFDGATVTASARGSGGGFNAKAGTAYRFRFLIALSSLSGSANSVSFGFGGTATLTAGLFVVKGKKGSGRGTTISATNFSSLAAIDSTASDVQTSAQLWCDEGVIVINAAGTIIPQVTMNTNSAASVVAVGSFFEIWEDDDVSSVSGDWT